MSHRDRLRAAARLTLFFLVTEPDTYYWSITRYHPASVEAIYVAMLSLSDGELPARGDGQAALPDKVLAEHVKEMFREVNEVRVDGLRYRTYLIRVSHLGFASSANEGDQHAEGESGCHSQAERTTTSCVCHTFTFSWLLLMRFTNQCQGTCSPRGL